MSGRVPGTSNEPQSPHWLEPAPERRRAAGSSERRAAPRDQASERAASRATSAERRATTDSARERRAATDSAAERRSAERRSAAAETPAERRAAERRAAERRAGQRRASATEERSRSAREPADAGRAVAAAERRSAARRRAAVPGLTDRAVLLTTTCLLLLFGLVMAYSASTAKAYFAYGSSWYLIERQAFFAVLGVIAMIVLARVDYVVWRRVATPLWVFALLSLLVVLVPGIGTEVNGARRWIIVAGFSYSPSELAKLACVMLVAGLVIKRPGEIAHRRRLRAHPRSGHRAGGGADHGRTRHGHHHHPGAGRGRGRRGGRGPRAPPGHGSARWRWPRSPSPSWSSPTACSA